MARICIPSTNDCQIQFFSMADEVQNMFNAILGFVLGISPAVWVLVLLTSIGVFLLYMFIAFRKISTMAVRK